MPKMHKSMLDAVLENFRFSQNHEHHKNELPLSYTLETNHLVDRTQITKVTDHIFTLKTNLSREGSNFYSNAPKKCLKMCTKHIFKSKCQCTFAALNWQNR